jgi:hypothetical protein
MKNPSRSMSAVLAKLANELPTLSPQNFIALSADTFKTGAIYSPISRVLSKEEITAMYAAAYGDNFAVIPETVEMHSEISGRNFVTALIRANLVSEPYNPTTVKARHLKALSKNVFVDNEDHIWRVSGEGEAARIVQSCDEDFGAILKERINSLQNVVMASCVSDSNLATHDTQNGDFVLFFSKAANAMDTGFAFQHNGGYTILSYSRKEWEDVSTNNIIRAAEIQRDQFASVFNPKHNSGNLSLAAKLESDLERTDGEFTKPMKNSYHDYMKFLFDGTDYFKKLDSLLNLRYQTGMDHLAVMTIR